MVLLLMMVSFSILPRGSPDTTTSTPAKRMRHPVKQPSPGSSTPSRITSDETHQRETEHSSCVVERSGDAGPQHATCAVVKLEADDIGNMVAMEQQLTTSPPPPPTEQSSADGNHRKSHDTAHASSHSKNGKSLEARSFNFSVTNLIHDGTTWSCVRQRHYILILISRTPISLLCSSQFEDQLEE